MSHRGAERYYYDPSRGNDQKKNSINLTSSSSEATNYSAQTQKNAPFRVEQITRQALGKTGDVRTYQARDPIGSYQEALSYGSPVVALYAQDQLLAYVSRISYETMSEQHYNMQVLDTSRGVRAQAGAGIDAVDRANARSPQEVLAILSGKAEGKLTCIDAANTVKSVLDQAGVENARIMTNIGVNHALNIMKLGEEYVVMSVDHPGGTPTIIRGKTPQDALNGYVHHIHGKRGKLDSGKITFQDDQGNPIGIYRTETRQALESRMGSNIRPLERSITHLNGQEGVHVTAGTAQVGEEVIAGGSAQWMGTLVDTGKTRIRMDAQLGAATIISPKQDPVGATLAASVGAHINHHILGSRGAGRELIGFANTRISADTAIDPNIGINMPDIQGDLSAGAVYATKLGEGSVRATAQVNALYGTPTNHQSFGTRYDGWDASLGYSTPQAQVGVRGGVSKSEGSRTLGVDASYQLTDNLTATGSVQGEIRDFGELAQEKSLHATAGVEYKPANSQVSYFANLNHTKTDQQERGNTGGAIGMSFKF